MSKFSNPKKQYSVEKKPSKVPVSFRCPDDLYQQVFDIASGLLTEWWVDAVAEKLERDREINEEIKRRLEK